MSKLYSDFGCTFEVKSEDERVATFSGIASTSDLDKQNDIIVAGAFDPIPMKQAPDGSTIPNVALLRDHEREQIIGGWRAFKQQGNHLLVEGELLVHDVPKARETHALMKKGYLSGLSVGFQLKSMHDLDFDENTGRRTIKKAVLRECSVVCFPANEGARITGVKSDLDQWLITRGFDPDDLATLLRMMKDAQKKQTDRKSRDLIKGIDGFGPNGKIDATVAAESLRDLISQMKGRQP